MGKALLVYATRTGETQRIAELVAEGIRISGMEAEVVDASAVKKEANLAGYDAVIFGSPTYHGEMLPAMKTLLFLAERSGLEGKVGGAFGAFGWSGEAPERIYQTMKHVLNMKMAGGPLMLKSTALEGGMRMAHDYGRQIAELCR